MTQILNQVEGGVGRIRLNRPKAIHALNFTMCEAMVAALLTWRSDPAITCIAIDHAEGRGFCAGGDVVALVNSETSDGAAARDFFRLEYQLNHLLFTYPKPTVSFMDGITMGGGVGISQPCRFRVATERTMFAMPETSIGLFPDVGAGRYLSRLPGRFGRYLALTGARLDGAECLALGLASHYIESGALDDVKARVFANPDGGEDVLRSLSTPAPDARIVARREEIDRCFASDKYEDILAALEAEGSEWAAAQHATLADKSPQACKVALRLLATAATIDDFATEMGLEFALASRVTRRPDFVEGVRALLIHKTGKPRWTPSTPEGVDEGFLNALFEPLPREEAWAPLV